MKKLIFLLNFVVSGSCFIGAMDEASCELIMLNGAKRTRYDTAAVKKYDNSSKYKPSLLLAAMKKSLPEELQLNIITKMCGVISKNTFQIPIGLALKFYHELCELEKICPYEFGNMCYSASQMFCLPAEKREKFCTLARKNTSFFDGHGAFKNGAMMLSEYEEVIQILPDHMLQGLQVPTYKKDRSGMLAYAPVAFGVGMTALGIFCEILAATQKSYTVGTIGIVCIIGGPVGGCFLRLRILFPGSLNPIIIKKATIEADQV